MTEIRQWEPITPIEIITSRKSAYNMKILFFTPVAAYPIHVGVLLDEMTKFAKNGHEIIYVYNNCCYDFCSANMCADTAICKLCKYDMQHMLNLVPPNVLKVNLSEFWNNDTKIQFQYNNVQELKKIEYKGVKTGYSVLSTYINATRNLAPLIDETSKKYFDALFLRSVKLTDAFEKVLDTYKPDRVCFYNARLLEQRPEYDLSRNQGIETYSYEVYAGWNEPFYKTKFINSTPHNLTTLHDRYRALWDNVRMPESEKEKVGRVFFEKKRAGIAIGDKVYVKNQTKGKIPLDWDTKKHNIVIFNSSEDEFSALGDEFDKLALFPSQYQGITFIANALKENPDMHIWLRIHPNLTHIPYRYHQDLHKLSTTYPNLSVIAGSDDVSSYDLMDAADKVVVFGSTIGLESAYHKKAVILLAGSIYYYSDICYVPRSKEELKQLLMTTNLPAKDNSEAIKIGFYYAYRNPNDMYEYIDFNKENIKFFNREWKDVYHYLKLFDSYKLYTIVKRVRYKLFYKKNRITLEIPTEENLKADL